MNYQRRLNQSRLDFERWIQELSYGYAWNIKSKYYHQLDPISISAVEVNKSQEFEDKINSLRDKLLAASFQNHIITSTRYRFVYNDPSVRNKSRISLYYDARVESAGNTLNTFYKLTNKPKDDVTNSYEIVGIPFAQYLKTQQNLIEKLLNDRINDNISRKIFNLKLHEIKANFTEFFYQFAILSHTVVINTSTQIVATLEQKVESHLLALLMPFTYVESAIY